jgi:Arc/MetJ-type ribon-helix-helix transcriptional regulator
MTKKDTEEQTERLQMRVSKKFLRLLDEWRESQDILPSRAEAIRRAVEMAAAAPKRKGK